MPEEEFRAHVERYLGLGDAAFPIFEREYDEAEALVGNIMESGDIETVRAFMGEASEDTRLTLVYISLRSIQDVQEGLPDDAILDELLDLPVSLLWGYLMLGPSEPALH